MAYLVLGISLLVAAALLARWFVSANPGQIIRLLRYSSIALLGIAATFLAVTGRFSLAVPAALGAVMLARRRSGGFRFGRGWQPPWMAKGGNPSTGQTSSVRTDWLALTLDHDSGAMDGTVLRGRYRGRSLSDLQFADLVALLAACQGEDEQSAALLTSYLDRTEGEDWRGRAEAMAGRQSGNSGAGNSSAGNSSGAMAADRAYDILGLQPGATDDEIRDAHRALMKKLHPDQGGSTFLAAQVNEAKELLLGRAR